MRKATLVLAPAIACMLFAAGLLSLVFVRAIQDTGRAVGTGLVAFGGVTPAHAKKADRLSGISLPFQSINIAVRGNHIVRVDDGEPREERAFHEGEQIALKKKF